MEPVVGRSGHVEGRFLLLNVDTRSWQKRDVEHYSSEWEMRSQSWSVPFAVFILLFVHVVSAIRVMINSMCGLFLFDG